ncbi:MAG: hypothetical protein ACTSPI_12060 [Candidatus Heimdallarchaeaceae archaeon]
MSVTIMECRFCKLADIENVEKNLYRGSHCGYSFEVSKWDEFYDMILKMPLSSWLVASMLWFSAMLTGVLFGLGFNSTSLSTTTLFLYFYGITAFLYGGSKSSDYFMSLWLWFKETIKGNKPDFQEIQHRVQRIKKAKIAKKSTASVEATSGKYIETDIRPGEMRVPHLATSFKAGILTILMGIIFSIVYGAIFVSQM